MATILPETMSMSLIFILIGVGIILVLGAYSFLLTMFALQIPNVKAQIVSQMKRRPAVLMHFINRKAEMFAPKRDGKDGNKNTLDLPDSLGAKFDASNQGIEEIWGKSILYNYFSKTSFPIKPEHAKAVNDFHDFLGSKGITPNSALIDFLLVEDMDSLDIYTKPLQDWVLKNLPLPIQTDKEYLLDPRIIEEDTIKLKTGLSKLKNIDELTDEDNEYLLKLKKFEDGINERINELNELNSLKEELAETNAQKKDLEEKRLSLIERIDTITGYLDPKTKETVYTLRKLKEELKTTIVKEGMFVFPKVQELVFAASSLNSSGMNEAVSIANADAYMQSTQDPGGWSMANVGALAVVLIVVLVGAGIAIKVAFG